MSKWWWKADYIETCNCTHGCSCNLTMLPTDGTCQGLNCYQIREGAYNGTRLDGLGIALINRWPVFLQWKLFLECLVLLWRYSGSPLAF
jgi:hypothetical protein